MTDRPQALGDDILATVRTARREFYRGIEPLRPELHRYCRRLAGNVWDAEDLVQETLTRAFARASQAHVEIANPIGWLVRIATNAYIDGWRRPAPVPAELPETAAEPEIDGLEVRDALGEVAMLLPPQERAAVVLKDVFDLSLAETAAMLSTSVGAVKAALHRGRARLAAPVPNPTERPRPSRAVLDAMAEAFTAYDLDRLAQLFLADAQCEVIGLVYEVGRDTIRNGSLHHSLVLETDVRYRAEVMGDVVVLWERPAEGGDEALGDVIRIETADGGIARMRVYYFCPELLTEFAAQRGLPVRVHGYHL
ncbi:MAG TPA: sigma-70 family RNA polymerase sigma factor [Micromonosporaceae bacterium]